MTVVRFGEFEKGELEGACWCVCVLSSVERWEG